MCENKELRANSKSLTLYICFRYIPENFYSAFTISDQTSAAGNAVVTQAPISSSRLPDYLETVVAAAGKANPQPSPATQNLLSAQPQNLSQSTVLQVHKCYLKYN